MSAVSELRVLLRRLDPVCNEGVYAFVSMPPGTDMAELQDAVVFVRETEGMTAVLAEASAARTGLPVLFRSAWITLRIHSALESVGLTAVVAASLAAAGISCNAVAGAFHDHLFVPVERAGEAMAILEELSADQSNSAEIASM